MSSFRAPFMHRSAGNHIIRSTKKHSVTCFTKRLLKQFGRSRPVITSGRCRHGDEGERSGANLQGDLAFSPRVCRGVWLRLASITSKSWSLGALIVERHVSHPISLSPAKYRHTLTGKFLFQRYSHYWKKQYDKLCKNSAVTLAWVHFNLLFNSTETDICMNAKQNNCLQE